MNNSHEFNSCAHLLDSTKYQEAIDHYRALLSNGKDPLAEMMNFQKASQNNLAELYPDRCISPDNLVTVGQRVDWLKDQKEAFDDEFRELIEAIAGMSKEEKDRSAVWKKWKSKYHAIRNEPYHTHSQEDQLEAKFEAIDKLHFFMNMLFAVDLSAEEIFVLYYLKNKENFDRWNNRGY